MHITLTRYKKVTKKNFVRNFKKKSYYSHNIHDNFYLKRFTVISNNFFSVRQETNQFLSKTTQNIFSLAFFPMEFVSKDNKKTHLFTLPLYA